MKKSANRTNPLEQGRLAFNRRAWDSAYRALSVADKDSPLAAEDLERLGQSAHLTGRETESLELLARTQQAYQRDGNLRSAARCAFWLGFISMLNGEMAQGGGWLARAQRLLDECGEDCVERGYLHIPEGYRAVQTGDPKTAYEVFLKAGAIGERFRDVDLMSMARQAQGRVLIRKGETARGLSLLDEVMIAVMADEVTPIVAGGIYCSVIESCNETFDVRRAHEWTTALERWCAAQPELVPYRGNCLIHRAEILQLHGEWPGALEEAQRAEEQFRLPKLRPGIGAAKYRLAELYRLQGEFDKAEAAYREASDWGNSRRPGLALLRLVQGQTSAAYNLAQQLATEATDTPTRARVLEALVEIAIAADDIPCARQAAQELAQIASRIDVSLLHASAAQALGAVTCAEGKFGESQQHLRKALALWRELNAPYECARVRAILAITCRELGDNVSYEAEFEAAAKVFRELGAKPDLSRLERLRSNRGRSAQSPLTQRELEVLVLVATGRTNRAIAKRLNISEKTVARHVSNIFVKLDLNSRAAATAYAFRHNLVPAAATT